jgi:hypothetical protein
MKTETAVTSSNATENIEPITMATAQKPKQLGLMGFINDDIGKVFGAKVIKNGKGVDVGSSVTMKSRKDMATALGLTGKDNKDALEKAILGQSDEAFRAVKGQVAALGADWTLAKVAQRTLGNGVKQISIVVKEIKRNTGPSDEAIAKSLGCTVAEVQTMRGRQVAALAEAEKNTVDA